MVTIVSKRNLIIKNPKIRIALNKSIKESAARLRKQLKTLNEGTDRAAKMAQRQGEELNLSFRESYEGLTPEQKFTISCFPLGRARIRALYEEDKAKAKLLTNVSNNNL